MNGVIQVISVGLTFAELLTELEVVFVFDHFELGAEVLVQRDPSRPFTPSFIPTPLNPVQRRLLHLTLTSLILEEIRSPHLFHFPQKLLTFLLIYF